MKIFYKLLLTWFLFIPVAILNGIIREMFYKPIIGDNPAHYVSTLIAIVLFFLLVYLMLRKNLMDFKTNTLLLIGLLWVVMTIFFEFGFGHYIDGISWERLLADYNLLAGRIWGIFLLVILLTPLTVKNVYKGGVLS